MIIQNSVLIKVEDSDIVNGTFTFPQGIESIGECAFYNCRGLTKINLPQGIESIGDSAFAYCRGLTTVNLPQGIESIGHSAFANCSKLTTVKLPQGITEIGYRAFYNCSGLTTVNNLKAKCFDSYPAIITSEHKLEEFTIFKGYNVEEIFSKTKNYYFVAEKDNFFSHGETIKKAIEDLNFKISREKLAKEPIYMDTLMSIARYRAITGSCQLGVENWMKKNNIKETDKLTVKELLPILEKTNAYGLSKFKEAIKDN